MSLLSWIRKNFPNDEKIFKSQCQTINDFLEISFSLKKQILTDLRNTYKFVYKFEFGIHFDIKHIEYNVYDNNCGCYQMIKNGAAISNDELFEFFGSAVERNCEFPSFLKENYAKFQKNQKELEEFKNQMALGIRSKLPPYFFSDKNNPNYAIDTSSLSDPDDCLLYLTEAITVQKLVEICMNISK